MLQKCLLIIFLETTQVWVVAYGNETTNLCILSHDTLVIVRIIEGDLKK